MNLANNITLLRILLVPVFVACLIYYLPERETLRYAALGIFLFACVTDAVDGWLARRLGQKTVLGSYIDPIADKLLLLSGFFSLSYMVHLPQAMRIPAWLTIAVITRDAIILIGSVIIFITTGRLKAEPLFIGKVTTVFQMLTLLAALCLLPASAQLLFFAATFVLTVASGIVYLRTGGRMLP